MARHLRSAILLAAAALVPAVLSAQTPKTWNGVDFADFAVGSNWTGNVAPANDLTTNYALFNNATSNQAAFFASRSVAGIDFTSTTMGSALSHDGGNIVLTLGAFGLRTSAAEYVAIDVALALGANSTFTDNGRYFSITSPLNLGANTLTLAGNSPNGGFSILSGLISGTGGLILNYTGAGGWFLGSNNTYTGNTTLTAGTLGSGDNGFGTGTLIFNGGRLAASSAVSYNNAVTVANGANFAPDAYAITLNGAVTLVGAQGFTISGTGSVILNGALGQNGTGDLSKSGTGALVLNGTSSYTGATSINMGTLAVGPSASLGTGNLVLTRGGVLSTSGTFSRTLGTGSNQFQIGIGSGGFAAYGGALSVESPSLTGNPEWTSFTTQYLYLNSTVADNVVTWTHSLQMSALGDYFLSVADNPASTADKAVFSGVLSGTGRLHKEGAGVLELSAANTYTGGTTSWNGTLRLTNVAALGTGAVTLQGTTTLALATDTAFDLANAFTTTSGTVRITSDRLTAGVGLMHQLGNLSSASTIIIEKGPNVTSGTPGIGFGAVTGGSFSVDVGARLELGSYAGTANTTFNGAGDTTILGTFNTGTGSLTKLGTGSLTLLGSSTRTGATAFSAGSLILGTDTALGTGAVTVSGSPTLSGTAGARTISNPFTLNSGLTLGGTSGLAFTGTITNANNNTLTVTNTGTTTFSGAIDLSNSSSNRVLTINHDGAVVLSGVIANGGTSTLGGLAKTGSGLLTLSGANTYAGGTSVAGGKLRLTNAAGLGTGAVTLESGATLELATDTALDLANPLQTNGGLVAITSDRNTNGTGLGHQLGDLSFSGTVNLLRGTKVTDGTTGVRFAAVTGTGTFDVAFGVALDLGSYVSASPITFTGAGQSAILGTFDPGNGSLTKDGLGTLILNTASPRTGPTTLRAGTLRLKADGALGTGSLTLGGSATIAGNANLTVANALTNAGDNTLMIANVGTTTFSGSVALSNSATNRVLTIDNADAVILSGGIVNGGTSTASGLSKTGAGLLTLSGANTFTGNLAVNAGTLSLTGSIASNLATVADGATLTGGGTLHNLTLNGIYDPGVGLAQVQLDNLTMASTAVLRMEIAGATPGSGHDVLNLAGTFAAAGTLNVVFANGYAPAGSESFQLFNPTGGFTGAFSQVNLPTLDANWTWDTSTLLTSGQLGLNFVAVPEPSTYALLATGLGLAVIARRRRNTRRSSGSLRLM